MYCSPVYLTRRGKTAYTVSPVYLTLALHDDNTKIQILLRLTNASLVILTANTKLVIIMNIFICHHKIKYCELSSSDLGIENDKLEY